MLTAITHPVSSSMNRCELGYLPRREIDVQKAAAQHDEYEALLAGLGLRVVSLDPEPDLPDAVFVEDPAVVVAEIAIMARMGAVSRRPETESVARELARYRPVRWLREPATLDGGDVMHAESTLYVGASQRTNAEGIRQLAAELEPFGYSVAPVEIRGCLHMKSACCYLGRQTVLANRAWIDPAPFSHLRILDVAPEEPWAANVLAVGKSAIIPSCFPATRQILERAGWNPLPVDVSEIMKAEGGVTCMSLIFENGQGV
jgi:dimethylargininase